MTSVCPNPCSRLATAAIFIIIGVVQLLAGVILLRSKYADLISGPDFMTGSSNIAIGCIYGIISSIWKINKKKKSVKVTARPSFPHRCFLLFVFSLHRWNIWRLNTEISSSRLIVKISRVTSKQKNVLAALLLSVISVNATAAIILIMGDGNRLLNLYIENTKHKTIDFAAEILAYAYIISVCSPIVCIVIALVILSGRFIEICRDINSSDKAKNIIANDDCYNWVFDPKTESNVKVVSDTIETSSESEESSEDSVFAEEEDCAYSRHKSIKNIPSPRNMGKDKRKKLLNEANRLREQSRLDLLIGNPNFYDYSNARLIPRIKESSLRWDLNPKLGNLGQKSSKAIKSILQKSSSNPVSRESGFPASYPANDLVHRYVRDQANYDEDQENRFPKYLRARKGMDKANKFTKTIGPSLNHAEATDNDNIHFVDPILSELKAETLKELKQKVAKILPGASIAVIKLPDNCEEREYMSLSENSDEPIKDTASSSLKPPCSEVSRYKLFTNCSESCSSYGKQLLSDKTPESMHQLRRWSENEPSAESAYKNKNTKTGLSTISRIRSRSFEYLNDDEEVPLQNRGDSKLASLPIVEEKRRDPLDSQRGSSSKQQNRKFDTSRKMSMASIAEIPSEEDYFYDRNSLCSASDFDDSSQMMIDENSNIREKMSPTSTRYIMKSSRRKSSLRSSKLLKKMWSSSEPKINVSDMIVDEDSLIGLSEEELLARTSRLRSLRKTVEHRLKTKKENEKQVAPNNYLSSK